MRIYYKLLIGSLVVGGAISPCVQAGPYDAEWTTVSNLISQSVGEWDEHPRNLSGNDPKKATSDSLDGTYGEILTAGPIIGNGDIGAIVAQTEGSTSDLTHYISANNFSGGENGQKQIAVQVLTKKSGGNSASLDPVRYEQDLLHAEVRASVNLNNTTVKTKSYIPPQDTNSSKLLIPEYTTTEANASAIARISTLITEISHTADSDVTFQVELIANSTHKHGPENNIKIASTPMSSGNSGNDTVWVTRMARVAVPANEWWFVNAWGCAVTRVFGAKSSSVSGNKLSFTVGKGQTVKLVTFTEAIGGRARDLHKVFTPGVMNSTIVDLKDKVLALQSAVTESDLNTYRNNHLAWWKNYWLQGYVDTGDADLNDYYFGALYVLASSNRDKLMPAGLFGPWLAHDNPNWSGGHYANYNYESQFYGLDTANRCDILDPFCYGMVDIAYGRIEDTRDKGYYGTMLMRTLGFSDGTAASGGYFAGDLMAPPPTTPSSTLDPIMGGGQKREKRIGAWIGGMVIKRWYKTRDEQFRDDMYGTLKDFARFYMHFIHSQDSTPPYQIINSHPNEASDGNIDTLADLAMIRYLFKGLMDMADEKGEPYEQLLSTGKDWKHFYDNLDPFPTEYHENKAGVSQECFVESKDTAGRIKSDGTKLRVCHKRWYGALVGAIYPIYEPGQFTQEQFNQIYRNTLEAADNMGTMDGKWNLGLEIVPWFGNVENNIPLTWPAAARAKFNGADPTTHLYEEFRDGLRPHIRNNLTVPQNGGGIETCGSIATIQEMMMQSHAGYIEFFAHWPDYVDGKFKRLRAEGAFLVDSEFLNGSVSSASIYSEKGRECTFKNPWPGIAISVRDTSNAPISTSSAGTDKFKFNTTPGMHYTIYRGSDSNLDPVLILKSVTGETSGDAPLNLSLTAIDSYDSDGSIVNYAWDFDNNGTVELQGSQHSTVTHSFATGSHTVKLTITDDSNKSVSATLDIKASAPGANGLVVHYDFEGDSGNTATDKSGFNNNGSLSASAYSWVAGHPNSSGGALQFTGAANGSDLSIPTAIDRGLKENNAVTITAWMKDVQSGSPLFFRAYDQASGQKALNVELNSTQGLFWDIGNNRNVTVSSPAFNGWHHWAFVFDGKNGGVATVYTDGVVVGTASQPYTLSGLSSIYIGQAKLTGTLDDIRIYAEALDAARIGDIMAGTDTGNANGVTAPVANFSATPTSGNAPLSVSFDGNASSDDGSVVSYSWDFDGDGSEDATGATASHTYTSGGLYLAMLTVTDDAGLTNTKAVTIDVTGGSSGGGVAPVASISATPQSGSAPLMVGFDASGSSDDGTIQTYAWDFDNNGVVDAYGLTTSHTYTSAGSYTAKLTVTDDEGLTHSTTVSISVSIASNVPTATSWWKLDETSGTTAADSIGNLDGTLYGNVAWTTAGKYDGGINNFTSGADYIDCGAMAGSQDDITVSFWVKATEMKYMFALDKLFDGDLSNDATVNGWAFRFKPGGEIVFQLGTASAVQQNVLAPAGSYAVGTWVHVAGSYNSTTRDAKIYINGSLAKLRSYTNEKPGNTTIPLRIGGTNDGEGNNRFRGTIDDVRIFDHALTATEIVDVMNDSGATVTPAGYDTWKSSITAGPDGRTDDADGDGIANLVEYALGLNPNAVDTTGRPTYTLNNNVVDYAFNALRTELTYEVEISNNLTIPTGWRTHGTASKGSGSLRTVNVPLTEMGTSEKLFLRLKVTE